MDPRACAEQAETFWSLVRSGPHWAFELFLMAVFDGLLGAVAWPLVRAYWRRHHRHDHCDPPATVTSVEAEPPAAPTCSDEHVGCRGDDPPLSFRGFCICPNVYGVHDRRTSCP